MKTHRLIAAALLSLFTLHPSLFSQSIVQPEISGTATSAPVVTTTGTTATPAAPSDDIVQLSPFTVTGSRDVGYAGLDTAAGSRVKTPLRDTAAAVSIFTDEFLNDIGATTVDDMLTYAGNVESDVDDTGAFDNNASRMAGNSEGSYRIRGLPATKTLDFVATAIPTDTYNVGRAEVVSGPNSILFGMGSQGGVINFTSKRADAQRNRLKLKQTIGTWTSPAASGLPFRRTELDYNLVLIPKVWAFRLMGVYQEGGGTSWIKWQDALQKRITPTVFIKPFQNTTINIKYETGTYRNSPTITWNGSDMITGWLDAGSPPVPVFNDAATAGPPGTTQIKGGGAYYVYVNGAPTLYNAYFTYQTANRWNYSTNPGIRLPASMSSYYYSTLGPGSQRIQKFDDFSVNIEQRFGNFNLELGYDHNKNNSTAYSSLDKDIALQGDPNVYTSSAGGYGGSGGVSGDVLNPNSQGWYMEDPWMQTAKNVRNDILRLNGEYSFNLKAFGRHRLVGTLEQTYNEQFNDLGVEILVDENGQAINNVNAPWNSNNFLYRRNYVTPGDFSTYHIGSWSDPIPQLLIGNHAYHNAYTNRRPGELNHVKSTINSAMLLLQSYFFNDKLATLAGLRFDNATSQKEQVTQITDPTDPGLFNGSKILNDYALSGQWTRYPSFQPYTLTAGGVYHLPFLSNRFSLFANYSTNRGLPYLDGRTVISTGGGLPPLTEGRTLDYGVMIDPLGNGKIFLRLTRFDTLMKGDAAIAPSVISGQTNDASLGSTNLRNIYAALGMAYAANGLQISDYMAPPPSYTAAMVNSYSRGYEAELTANITKNFTLRATFSYTDRNREDIMYDVIDYYNKNIPVWFALANRTDAIANYAVPLATFQSNLTGTMPLTDFLNNQLYASGAGAGIGAGGAGLTAGTSVRQGLITLLNNQSGPMGSRPYKFNIRARYTFTDGLLKGFALGGGVRYQSANQIPNLNTKGSGNGSVPEGAMNMDLGTSGTTMLDGSSLLFYDAMLTYKCKLFGGRTTMTLQFNVNNIFNKYVIGVGRLTTDANGGQWTRVYMNTPRSYRLSATFDF